MLLLRPEGRRSTHRKIVAFRLWPAPELPPPCAPPSPLPEQSEASDPSAEGSVNTFAGVDSPHAPHVPVEQCAVPAAALGAVTPLEGVLERSNGLRTLLGKVNLFNHCLIHRNLVDFLWKQRTIVPKMS